MAAWRNDEGALDPELAGELARQLMAVSLWTARRHDPLFERLGLSAPTARALLQLPPDAAVPTRFLAGRLKVDPSNVTGVVDRLEGAGLVERGSEPDDRRVKTLALTQAGRKMRDDMYAAIASEMPALSGLTDAELDSLLDLLNKAWAACMAHDAADPGRAPARAALI
ncbi:MAG TPA: MarR family transcriptional regulator [Streptosporangiaceae bacterium]|jgi:DNA-binding MarR family transcriptional regulator